MDDQEFKRRADHSLNALYKKLAAASDDGEFEVDFNSGALSIAFERPPGKFVISPNAPVRQIWVSARPKSFTLAWDEVPTESVFSPTDPPLLPLIHKPTA